MVRACGGCPQRAPAGVPHTKAPSNARRRVWCPLVCVGTTPHTPKQAPARSTHLGNLRLQRRQVQLRTCGVQPLGQELRVRLHMSQHLGRDLHARRDVCLHGIAARQKHGQGTWSSRLTAGADGMRDSLMRARCIPPPPTPHTHRHTQTQPCSAMHRSAMLRSPQPTAHGPEPPSCYPSLALRTSPTTPLHIHTLGPNAKSPSTTAPQPRGPKRQAPHATTAQHTHNESPTAPKPLCGITPHVLRTHATPHSSPMTPPRRPAHLTGKLQQGRLEGPSHTHTKQIPGSTRSHSPTYQNPEPHSPAAPQQPHTTAATGRTKTTHGPPPTSPHGQLPQGWLEGPSHTHPKQTPSPTHYHSPHTPTVPKPHCRISQHLPLDTGNNPRPAAHLTSRPTATGAAAGPGSSRTPAAGGPAGARPTWETRARHRAPSPCGDLGRPAPRTGRG